MSEKISVGVVTACHGIKGELKVKLLTEFPERFEKGSKLYIGKTEQEASKSIVVKSSRFNKGYLLLSIEGVEDRNAAENLRGSIFWINRDDVKKLPDNSFYIFELEGLTAVDLTGKKIGVLSHVVTSPSHDLYMIEGEEEIIVPAVKKFVKKVDIAAGTITIDTESLQFED